MTVEQPSAPIGSIQCLRGIAALMVVILHLQNQLGRLGLARTDWPALAAGVDIFFVISGFIMWVTTAAKPERSALAFYGDRVTRIVPLYWAITAVLVAVLVVAPGLASTAVLDWPHVLQSFLFIPALHPITQHYQPTLIPGWTLNMEMFFYLLFGGAIALGGMNLKLRARLILSVLAAIVILGHLLRPQGVAGFYAQDMVGEFALGILIGIGLERRRSVRSNWFWLPLLVGAVMLCLNVLPPMESRLLRWGVPAALVVLGAVFVPQSWPRFLQRLGDWSYSLYLSHPLTLSASEWIWRQGGGTIPLILFPVFAVGVCVAAAAVIYRTAEIPMTDVARQLMGKGAARRASVPA